MNKDYLKFLKFTNGIYKNIHWMNKNKVIVLRKVWLEVREYKNYSLTRHFFSKHKMLLKMELRTASKSYRLNCCEYWLMRGWSESVSKNNVSELQSTVTNKSFQRLGCSTSSRKYLELKGTQQNDIDAIMRSRDRFSFAHCSEEQLKSISNKGTAARIKQIKILKTSNPYLLKTQFTTTLEYYLSRGYTEIEARKLLKDRQTTFSLKKLRLNHSQEEAEHIWYKRQIKWQKTMNSKSQEEKEIINSKKAVTLVNLQKKYGMILGEQKYIQILSNRKTPGSKEANNFFSRLLSEITFDELPYWCLGIMGKEYFLYDQEIKRFYFYDFVLKNKKIIIEYNGEAFHPRKEKLTEHEWDNWKVPFTNESAESKYAFDCYKNDFARKQGFTVIEVWSSDSFEESLQKIVKYI